MSILNCWVSPSRILVGVDTVARSPAFGGFPAFRGSGSKLQAFPHASMVLAHRGNGLLFTMVLYKVQQCLIPDLDSLDKAAPKLFADAFLCYQTVVAQKNLPFPIDEQQILIAGWSQMRNQMIGIVYRQTDRAKGFVRSEIGGAGFEDDLLCGWDADAQGEAPVPSNERVMLEVLHAQVAHAYNLWPDDCPVGGDLIVADLTRHAIGLTRYPEKNASAHGSAWPGID